MEKKNILIIGANSELAKRTIDELKNKNYAIWATSRSVEIPDEKIHTFRLDITKEEEFILLKEKFKNIKFDTIVNFVGIAIASAVVELDEADLKKQLDVNLYGLLKVIKYFCPALSEGGKLVNVSSMASYGIFPFLSPYCISKAASDILLNLYSVESNIKVVSVRPGAVATKFWDTSIELNKKCLENLGVEAGFKDEKIFLVKNAHKNSLKAHNPIYIAKKIASIIDKKNPKAVYNLGYDAKITKLTRFLPQDFINKFTQFVLKSRIKKL